MTNPGPDHTAVLDRLDRELAEMGSRVALMRADLGTLRAAPAPMSAPSPAPVTVPTGPAPGSGPTPAWHPAPAPGPWAHRPGPSPSPAAAGPGPRTPGRVSVPRVTGAQLLAWTGTAVTLLGVVLLLLLAASRGWFGAEARVVFGGVVGLALLGAAVVLHRGRTGATESGPAPAAADPGPVSLAATGITALYLTVAAAVSLYALVPVAVGLVVALAVTGAGLALADRWRSRALGVGVVVTADLLVPFVVEAPGGFLVGLLVVVLAVSAPLAVRRGWSVPSVVATSAATLGALVSVVDAALLDGATGTRAAALTAAVVALLVVAAATAVALAAHGDDRPRGAVVAAGTVLALPLLPLLVLAPALREPRGAILDVAVVVGLLVLGAACERGVGPLRAVPVLAAVAATAAAVVGLQALPLALTGQARDGGLLAVAVVLAVVALRTGRRGVLVAAAVFGFAGFGAAVDSGLDRVVVAGVPASVGSLVATAASGALLAAAAGTLLAALGRQGLLGDRSRAATAAALLGFVGLLGAATVVVALALAVSPTRTGFLVGHVLVTVSWTALALALLVRGVGSGVLRVLGGVLVVAAVAKLILFDLGALDGLARVVVFLLAGLVLLVAGTRYARLVADRSAVDGESGAGRLPEHG